MSKRTVLTVSVEKYIREHHMTQTGDQLLVALSGGGDSVCLLCVLKELEEVLGVSVAALHVHHGIRGIEADEDAQFCRELCCRLQVPFETVYVDVPAEATAKKISLEEAARQARYRELEAWRQRRERPEGEKDPEGHGTREAFARVRIAVGHHREDQAETVLWNLFRGTGLKGLGGMAPINGALIRPLLDTSKEEILGYLKDKEQSWQSDHTNEEDDYTRNRIRHHILNYAKSEINDRSAAHICQAAAVAAQADSYLRHQAQRWLDRNAEGDRKTGLVLSAEALQKEEEILQTYVLREALAGIGGLTDMTARHVQAMQGLLEDRNGGSALRQLDLTAQISAQRSYGRLWLYRKQDEQGNGEELTAGEGQWKGPEDTGVEMIVREGDLTEDGSFCREVKFAGEIYEVRIFPREKEQNFPTNQYTKWINYDKLEGTFVFRTRRTGDYILLPGGGRKTVKAYMIDEKIPSELRDRIPVLAQGSHVLWIVGYRLSEEAKITEDTRRILEVTKRETARIRKTDLYYEHGG